MTETYNMEFLGKPIVVSIDYADYDPDMSHDGGSYYQPVITAVCGNDTLTIKDTSCGDFGSRIDVRLDSEDDNTDPVFAHYGSMESDSNSYTDFSAHCPRHMFWLSFAGTLLDYHIPFIEENEVDSTRLYFVNDDVDPDTIYGNTNPVCIDDGEYSRLINTEGWTDLPKLMHEANWYEIKTYGYCDSNTGETYYGGMYYEKED